MKPKKLASAASVVALILAGVLLSATPSIATPAPAPEIEFVDTGAVTGSPTAVAVDSTLGRLYVTTSSPDVLWVLDEATFDVVDTLALAGSPRGIAVDEATHTVYVAGSDGVTVVDGDSAAILATVQVGSDPSAVAVGSTGDAYVANSEDHTVSVIDGDMHEVSATIPVDTYPQTVAADLATGLVYVGNYYGSSVSVIDGETNTVTDTIDLASNPIRVAVDSSSGLLYITMASQAVAVVETATNGLVDTIVATGSPRAIAVDETSHAVYTAHSDGSSVSVIDPSAGEVAQAVTVGSNPTGIAVNQLTHRVYVVSAGDSALWVFAPVIPDVVSTSSASVVVSAGARSASLADLDLEAVPYSHAEQAAAGSTLLSVDDSSGSAAGWAVTTEVSAFAWSSPGGAATDAADIAAANLAITSVGSVSTVSGQEWATDPIAVTGALNSPVTVLTAAADAGQGSYTLPVNMSLTVPGTTRAGTYTATLTTTLSVAP